MSDDVRLGKPLEDTLGKVLKAILGGLLGDPLERSDGDILWDVLGDTL